MVTRRQETVMSKFIRTNQFVSSLFPAGVRDRVLEEANDRNLSNDRRQEVRGGKSDGVKAFLGGGGDHLCGNDARDSDGVYTTKPIAAFYPETTVMVSITVMRETLICVPSSILFGPVRSYAQPFSPSFESVHFFSTTATSLTTLVKWMEVFNGMYVCMYVCAYAKYSIVGSRTICTHWRLKY